MSEAIGKCVFVVILMVLVGAVGYVVVQKDVLPHGHATETDHLGNHGAETGVPNHGITETESLTR